MKKEKVKSIKESVETIMMQIELAKSQGVIKDEFWIKVRLEKPKFKYEDSWYNCRHESDEYLIKNNSLVSIYNYDADTKPLHKLVKLKKTSEKFNIWNI